MLPADGEPTPPHWELYDLRREGRTPDDWPAATYYRYWNNSLPA